MAAELGGNGGDVPNKITGPQGPRGESVRTDVPKQGVPELQLGELEFQGVPKIGITIKPLEGEAHAGQFGLIRWAEGTDFAFTSDPEMVRDVMEAGPMAAQLYAQVEGSIEITSIDSQRMDSIRYGAADLDRMHTMTLEEGYVTFHAPVAIESADYTDAPDALDVDNVFPADTPTKYYDLTQGYREYPVYQFVPELQRAMAYLGVRRTATATTLPLPDEYQLKREEAMNLDDSGIFYPPVRFVPHEDIHKQKKSIKIKPFVAAYAAGEHSADSHSFAGYNHDLFTDHSASLMIYGEALLDMDTQFAKLHVDDDKKGLVIAGGAMDELSMDLARIQSFKAGKFARIGGLDLIVDDLKFEGVIDNLHIVKWMKAKGTLAEGEEITAKKIQVGFMDYAIERFGEPEPDVARGFTSRLLAQQEFEQALLEGEPTWRYPEGLYTDGRLFTNGLPDPIVTFEDREGIERTLKGVEVILAANIQAQIDQKPQDRPVVVFDLGGGIGKTWAKLARYFQDDVENGNVAFVVSNGKNAPEDYEKYDPADAAPDLVHFVTGKFSELGEKSIVLADGRILPLAGNIDVMHEDNSLTNWTKIPEKAIPEAATLLSPQAVYLVPDAQTTEISRAPTQFEWFARLEGIQIAHNILQNRMGFSLVETIEQGEYHGRRIGYKTFKAPNAPRV